jgi:hypothetical protein
LFRAEIQQEPFEPGYVKKVKEATARQFSMDEEDIGYFVTEEPVSNNAYNPDHDRIKILTRKGELLDVSKASDQLNISILSTTTQKYLLSYPKDLIIP